MLLAAVLPSTTGVIQGTESAIHLNVAVRIFYLKLPLMNTVCINLADLVLKQVRMQSIKSPVAAGITVGASSIPQLLLNQSEVSGM